MSKRKSKNYEFEKRIEETPKPKVDYFFPKYSITVKATSIEDAKLKLSKILRQKID